MARVIRSNAVRVDGVCLRRGKFTYGVAAMRGVERRKMPLADVRFGPVSRHQRSLIAQSSACPEGALLRAYEYVSHGGVDLVQARWQDEKNGISGGMVARGGEPRVRGVLFID